MSPCFRAVYRVHDAKAPLKVGRDRAKNPQQEPTCGLSLPLPEEELSYIVLGICCRYNALRKMKFPLSAGRQSDQTCCTPSISHPLRSCTTARSSRRDLHAERWASRAPQISRVVSGCRIGQPVSLDSRLVFALPSILATAKNH